ncbi:MAG: ABC transporter permease [Erysipelotrichaceae bacterium]|nr:ABC transporter permease [Erysipelotrichaceae bacterium]
MNKILAIVKKELFRFLTDKKLMLTTVFLPGLMIYGIYSFMGEGMANMFEADEELKPQCVLYHLPETLNTRFKTLYMDQVDSSQLTVEQAKEKIAGQELDLVVVFPENFDEAVLSGSEKPEIEIYYNSVNNESARIYQFVVNTLDSYEESIANVFTMNSKSETYDLATEEDVSAMIYSMMLPMLLLTFVYSGCISVAPESIAGEKERGTIATLLITPMKRSGLALGKVISLSIVALMSGVSSFLGTMLSLPKLMGSTEMENMSAAVYSAMDYFLLFLIVVSAVLLLTALISIISAWTSSVKEASTAVSPLMIVVMLIGVSSMLLSGERISTLYYLIPLYNLVLCMNGIFSFSYELSQIFVALSMNVAVTAMLIVLLTKMFNSEKVMFSK